MTRRKRLHPELRRQQIVTAAIHVFFEMGYEGASLRDLAARVGINKATVYHYFASKEEILYHIVREVGSGLLDGVRRAARSCDDPLAALEGMVRFQIEYMENHLEEVKVLVEEKKSLRAELLHATQDTESEILTLYKETLGRCLESGLICPVQITTAAFGILGQVNWLYHWYQPEGPLSIGELADQVVSLLFHGLVPPPAA